MIVLVKFGTHSLDRNSTIWRVIAMSSTPLHLTIPMGGYGLLTVPMDGCGL